MATSNAMLKISFFFPSSVDVLGGVGCFTKTKGIGLLWYTSFTTASKLALKVLVATIDVRWEGMGDVGSARYEPALLLPCPTMRVQSYSS